MFGATELVLNSQCDYDKGCPHAQINRKTGMIEWLESGCLQRDRDGMDKEMVHTASEVL
jgi:hypothetical protein